MHVAEPLHCFSLESSWFAAQSPSLPKPALDDDNIIFEDDLKHGPHDRTDSSFTDAASVPSQSSVQSLYSKMYTCNVDALKWTLRLPA